MTGMLRLSRKLLFAIEAGGVSAWPRMTKEAVAERLALRIADHLAAEGAPVEGGAV